jgi:hypothetical protein
MGHALADMELSHPREPELKPIRARSLADTRAWMLCIPEHIALQLKLATESLREVSVDPTRPDIPHARVK